MQRLGASRKDRLRLWSDQLGRVRRANRKPDKLRQCRNGGCDKYSTWHDLLPDRCGCGLLAQERKIVIRFPCRALVRPFTYGQATTGSAAVGKEVLQQGFRIGGGDTVVNLGRVVALGMTENPCANRHST